MLNHKINQGSPKPVFGQRRPGTGSNTIPLQQSDRPYLQLTGQSLQSSSSMTYKSQYNQMDRGRNRKPFQKGPANKRGAPIPFHPPPVTVQRPIKLEFSKKSTINEPAKNFRIKENCLCSMFLINVEPGQVAYRYDVDIVAKGRKDVPLSKGPDDGLKALNRNLCYELLALVHQKTDGFGMTVGSEIVYDCKTLLYTSSPIRMPSTVIELKSNEVVDYVRTYYAYSDFTISISPNQACPILDISDINQYMTDRSVFEEDRTVRTFLEMAITQFSINQNVYSPVGAGKLYETSNVNEEDVGTGTIIRSGVSKGVRVVENYGKPMPALVLDMKMSPFYRPQSLIQTVLAFTGGRPPSEHEWRKISRFIFNIRVEVVHNRQKNFAVGKLTDKPLSQLRTKDGDRHVSVVQFFAIRHKVDLQYPDFPGVSPNVEVPKNRKPEYYPLEQLVIMEDQRVPLEKMGKRLSDKLLKASTLPPSDRFKKIMLHADEMGVFNQSNAVLRAFGINIDRATNQIVVGVRPCPKICYGNRQTLDIDVEKAEWSKQSHRSKYVDTIEIGNWFVFCDAKYRPLVHNFIEKYKELATECGMVFKKDPIYQTFNGNNENWKTKYDLCIRNRVSMDFVLLIDSEAEDSHNLLKYCEALNKILTQHITIEKVQDVLKGKNQILKNIINKSNCKNFGLNYIPLMESASLRFQLENLQVLVLAYDVAHPPPVTSQDRRIMRLKGLTVDSVDPSVVGIVANMAENPHSFVGDYFFQESRKEKVDSTQLLDRVSWIFQTLALNRGAVNARPRYIFVLRDGLSEGQHMMAFDDEMAAIRSAFKEVDPDYEPKMVFVIGTKRHFKKFFAMRNGAVENLAPGTVIAEKFVRSDLPEFFMQSHYPIKGVGKPVEYTVICDEIGVSQDELQGFLNALCYSHQIVSSAISLPEPIYQADELAKRGRNNYLTMKQFDPHFIKTSKEGLVICQELSRMLSYRYDEKNLVSTRFTA